MARVTVPVNKEALIQVIQELESNNTYANRNQLHEAVAELYNKTNTPHITSSIVFLRIKEFNIEVKTPKGKRGRGVAMTEEHKAALQAARGKAKKKKYKPQADYDTMRKRAPESIHSLIDKVQDNGSARKAIKLMCLQCCAYVKKEIANCTGRTCGLYDQRPYQNFQGREIIEDIEDDEEQSEETEVA